MESNRYMGAPCLRGHSGERFLSNRSCVDCIRDAAVRKERQPLYNLWRLMVGRCTRPGSYGYGKYGAKGIMVCDRWRKFANFAKDMGDRPIGTTLDRIDPLGDYTPENCRWATLIEQANNKTNTRHIRVGNEDLPFTIACRSAGVRPDLVRQRIDRLGWPVEDAFSMPASPKAKVKPHRNSAKTHCIRGHPLAGENLYVRPSGRRECKACRRIK